MAKRQVMDMEGIIKKREEAEAMLKRLEGENAKLKEVALRLVKAKDEQNKLKTFVNDTDKEMQGSSNVTSQGSWTKQHPKKTSGKPTIRKDTSFNVMQTNEIYGWKRQIISSDEEDPKNAKAPPGKKKDMNKTEEE
jgi:hypothetical protein